VCRDGLVCSHCGSIMMVRCSGSLHGNEAVVCVSKCLFVGDPMILPHELVSLECIANASIGA
jgi:hypothetical protein